MPRWNAFVDALARQRRVVAPSLPGFPGSSALPELDDHLDWLLAARDLVHACGGAGGDLVAVSVGAALAADVAAVWPGAVRRLVMVSPLGLFDPAEPRDWGTVEVYFGITIILSVLGWTGLARTVRGKFLALREEDFTQAAKYLGASEMRIIPRHMVPSFSSHLIAVLTLRVPEMILAETSLSFLGLGLREPVISWGVLLTGVQNIRAVALAPWLFLPGLAIVVTVLAFNFVGDGLRDAADPYAQ